MPRLRISLLGLLGLVAFLAVLMVAFIYATDFWANLVFTLMTALLLGGIVAATYRTGARRAFWFGFNIFGWSYALFVFGPWFESNLGPSLLTSDLMIRQLHLWIEPTRAARAADPGFTPVQVNENRIDIGLRRSWDVWGGTWTRSRRIGNGAGTLLWAVIGGMLARKLYTARVWNSGTT